MSHFTYNLLYEPWIPCVTANGDTVICSVTKAFSDAHRLREIRGDTPVVTIGLYRLLMSIFQRAAGPTRTADWQESWGRGEFDMDRINSYLEPRRTAFDLFDPEKPFFQTAGLETPAPLPANVLHEEYASGNNPTLFDHGFDNASRPLSLPATSQGLVARQSFALGLGKPPKGVTVHGKSISVASRHDGPLARGLVLLVRGISLFHTIMLNTPARKSEPDDLPIWDRDSPEELVDDPVPVGRMDLFTFQCRRIRLVEPGDGPGISRIHFVQGRIIDKASTDPMKPYRRSNEYGWMPFSLLPERAVWRDSAALFAAAAEVDRPHEALGWAARLAEAKIIAPHDVQAADAFGVATDPGKATSVTLWRHERIPLPLEFLTRDNLQVALGDGLARVEHVASLLELAAFRFVLQRDSGPKRTERDEAVAIRSAAKSPKPKPKPKTLADAVRLLNPSRQYWSMLEPNFREFLARMLEEGEHGEPPAQAVRWFMKSAAQAAKASYAIRVDRSSGDARSLRAATVGRQQLHSDLTNLVHKHTENQDVKK